MQSSAPRTLTRHFQSPSISLPTRVVTDGSRIIGSVFIQLLDKKLLGLHAHASVCMYILLLVCLTANSVFCVLSSEQERDEISSNPYWIGTFRTRQK